MPTDSHQKLALHALRDFLEGEISLANGYWENAVGRVFIGRQQFDEAELPAWFIWEEQGTTGEKDLDGTYQEGDFSVLVGVQAKALDPKNPGDTLTDYRADIIRAVGKINQLAYSGGVAVADTARANLVAGISEDDTQIYAAIVFNLRSTII